MEIIKKNFLRNQKGNFLIAFFILVGVIGIVEKMLVPLTPITGPDSIGYLGVAFRFMTNGVFSGIAERSYPYPAFLTLIISKSKDVENIVLFQRIFSLLSAFIFYRILQLIYVQFNIDTMDRHKIYKPLSVFLTLLVIFSPSQNFFDQCAHPESLTLPIVILLTYAMLKLYKYSVMKNFYCTLLWLSIAFFTNYFFGILQPRMTLACYFIDVLLIFFLFSINTRISIKLLFLAIPLCMIIGINNLLLIRQYPTNNLVKCQQYASLFYYNLNTISKLINEDINDPHFNQINKSYLKKILMDYEESKKPQYIKYSSGRVTTIGYNTDYLMNTYTFLLQQKGETVESVTSIYRYYLHKAVKKAPISMTTKILKEFFSYYTRGLFFKTRNTIRYVNFWWKGSLATITSWPAIVIDNKVYSSYAEKLKSSINSGYERHDIFEKPIGLIYRCLNFLFLPIFIMALIILFYNHCIRKDYHRFGVFLFLLIVYHNLILLTVSIGASTVYKRYIYDLFPTTISIFALSLIYILFFFRKDSVNSMIRIKEA